VPDELTTDQPAASRGHPGRDGALVLALCAAGGVLAGLVWRWLGSPPHGVVVGGVWYADPDAAFSGTALYVLVGAAIGLLVGAACGLAAAGQPLVTLALVVVGSALAGWLMLWTGTLGVPPDPQDRAGEAADGAELTGTLEVSGWSPFVAFPAGALAGLCAIFVTVSPKSADGHPGRPLAG
jgi:hypothetical protein